MINKTSHPDLEDKYLVEFHLPEECGQKKALPLKTGKKFMNQFRSW